MGSLRSRRKGAHHPCLRSRVNLVAFSPNSNSGRKSHNRQHCHLVLSVLTRCGGGDGHPASAVTQTISPQLCCFAKTPRKRPPVCWKIPTRRTISQILLSNF